MKTFDELMPWDKSRIIRYCFLDVMFGYEQYALDWLEANYETLSDDLLALRRTIKQYVANQDLDVGESGTLLRFWRWLLWSTRDTRNIKLRGTLLTRQVCNDPSIVNLSIDELLKLDGGTSQWASAAVLHDNTRYCSYDPPPHLKMTYSAINTWQAARHNDDPIYDCKDETITTQAKAFLSWKDTGVMEFKPQKGEDFCFASAFGLMTPEQGSRRWPALRGHESNRVLAMKEAQAALCWAAWDGCCHSRDHRVVQALAMRYGDQIMFTHPECVTKSWPQFHEFMVLCGHISDAQN